MLDRYGLSMPSTHVPATDGPDLEKQLEGFQIMGIQYTEISGPAEAGAGAARPRKPREQELRVGEPRRQPRSPSNELPRCSISTAPSSRSSA